MIHINNIYIEFDEVVIKDGSIDIYYDQITGIVGESGSGKTSLLLQIGLLDKNLHMNYEFNNQIINHMNQNKKDDLLRNDISFIMQDIYFFEGLTIKELIKLYAQIINKDMSEEDIYQLLHNVNLQLSLDTPIDTLSGGEKQRLSIACGLLKNAQLFIFDEPFAYLDKQNQQDILNLIKKLAYEEHKMVVITTHNEDMWNQFDRLYAIKDNQLSLIKDSHPNQIEKHLEHTPFQFRVLKSYVHLNNQHHRLKNIMILSSFIIVISLLVSIGKFNENYQKATGTSILNLMKNEVMIIHKDASEITPKEQTILRSNLYEYTLYSDYTYQSIDNISLAGYLDNEKDSFQIFMNLESDSIINNKNVQPIYISYSLYKRNNHENQLTFIDSSLNQLNIQCTYILDPSDETNNIIYIPYDTYIQILNSYDIDTNLENTNLLKIPINSIDDIKTIKEKLPDNYTIIEPEVIKISLDTAQLFNRKYINILTIILLLALFIYKIFEFIKDQKDIALWKMLGVQNKQLILMKVYQESIYFILITIMSIIICTLFLLLFNILTYSSFINIVLLIIMYDVILYVLLLIIYILLIINNTTLYIKS